MRLPCYQPQEDDAPNTLYALIGFLIPIVGLILYLVENARRPQRAASAGKGVLWGLGTSVLLPLFIIIVLSILGNRIKNTFNAAPSGAPVPGIVLGR